MPAGTAPSYGTKELDDRRRARMLDESLEILVAAWSGELVQHRGEHYTVEGMRFLPRPVQEPGVPVWVAGSFGKTKPLRRAAKHDGFFPMNLENPDQLSRMGRGGDRDARGHRQDRRAVRHHCSSTA